MTWHDMMWHDFESEFKSEFESEFESDFGSEFKFDLESDFDSNFKSEFESVGALTHTLMDAFVAQQSKIFLEKLH